MPVTITLHAKLIATLADSGGGAGGDIAEEMVIGSNSIHEIAGVFYALVLTPSWSHDDGWPPSVFQMYASSDSGATWATCGSSFTPTSHGGGMSSFTVGTTIWVSYSQSFHRRPFDQHLYLTPFDTVGPAWGTELSFDCGDGSHAGVGMRIEGPYTSHIRPDGSFAFIISDTLTAEHWAVTYNGSFHGPYQLLIDHKLFEASLMRSDGTVDVFYGTFTDPTTFYHQTFDASNTVGTSSAVSGYSGDILSWSDVGLGFGYLKSGTYYLACGKKTSAYPTIFGQPAIFYGSDGAWTLGALLDTDAAIADFSVYLCSLQLVSGMLIYYWRGVSSDGSSYIDRVGYAPEGSHDTPADWTWQTVYNLASPSPAVSGQTGPYVQVPVSLGSTTGLIQTSDEIRMVTTLQNNSGNLFVTYLFSALVGGGPVIVFGNEFR